MDMRRYEGDQRFLSPPLGIQHGNGLAVLIQRLTMHAQDRMRAVIHDVGHDAQQDALLVLLAIDYATNEVDPIVFVGIQRRKFGARHPYCAAAQLLSLSSVLDTFQPADDGAALSTAFKDLDRPCRRKGTRLRRNRTAPQPPFTGLQQGRRAGRVRLDLDPAPNAVGAGHTPELDQIPGLGDRGGFRP